VPGLFSDAASLALISAKDAISCCLSKLIYDVDLSCLKWLPTVLLYTSLIVFATKLVKLRRLPIERMFYYSMRPVLLQEYL